MRQHVLNYLGLLKFCTDGLTDCKSQIMQLTTQINNIFATLNQTGQIHAERGIIHFLFNFLFGNPNSLAEINAVKNNMAILEENQDILSNQIKEHLIFVNVTYVETDTNQLILKSSQ